MFVARKIIYSFRVDCDEQYCDAVYFPEDDYRLRDGVSDAIEKGWQIVGQGRERTAYCPRHAAMRAAHAQLGKRA